MVLNAFSIDVEDYYQVLNFQKRLPRAAWDTFEPRVEGNTRRVLDLLDGAGVRATFFCLGWLAERHPGLIREIAERGHELGSHGWSHTPLHELGEDGFREEAGRTKALLEDLGKATVLGFRAPSFSITARTRWGLDVLLETGHRYDSSIFPVRHPDYGIPGAEEWIHRLATPAGQEIVEFPLTVARFLGRRVPVAGGGYFRLLPLRLTCWGLAQVNRQGRPGVFYLHPWEVDPGQPDLRKYASRLGAWRHYQGLSRTEDRLRLLLARFRFAPLGDVLREQGFL